MAQEHKQRGKSSQTEDETSTEASASVETAERKDALDEETDSILDEIDEVLESNAEDFVKSFIQKGGE